MRSSFTMRSQCGFLHIRLVLLPYKAGKLPSPVRGTIRAPPELTLTRPDDYASPAAGTGTIGLRLPVLIIMASAAARIPVNPAMKNALE